MATVATNNLDYLATRLHARRSRMAEGERLDELCHLRTIPELGQALGLDLEFQSAAQLQRRLVQDLFHELASCARHVGEVGGELFGWILVRFQVENMKTLIRGFLNRRSPEVLQEHLLPLPESLALDVQGLATAGSMADFIELLPPGILRERLNEVAAAHHDQPQPFYLEAAIDSAYFQMLLVKTRHLSGEDLTVVRPLMLQEANFFQFMLAVRGRFNYDLPPDVLLSLEVPGLSKDWFKTLLSAPDVMAAAKGGLAIVLDELPRERGDGEMDVDGLCWKRFHRLANRAFCSGDMGLGVAVGYAGLRRVETANLITLSEGIRTGMTAEAIRGRLIPRADAEVAYV